MSISSVIGTRRHYLGKERGRVRGPGNVTALSTVDPPNGRSVWGTGPTAADPPVFAVLAGEEPIVDQVASRIDA
jgi:hypothetical protein